MKIVSRCARARASTARVHRSTPRRWMDIDRDRDRPREGFERVRARRRDGPPHRWTARWMDTHTQKKYVSARRRVSSRLESSLARGARRTSAASRMYVSSAHSIACAPSGVSKVTVYRARTEPRAILAPAVRRAATRTGARTARGGGDGESGHDPGESGCEVFRARSIHRDARARGARAGGVGLGF